MIWLTVIVLFTVALAATLCALRAERRWVDEQSLADQRVDR